jgi:hypothetical protein
VLHVPANIGANPQGLVAAERELGLVSRSVLFERNPYYEGGEVLWPDDPNILVRELHRARLLLRALREFDVVHFNFGMTIAPPWVPPGAAPPDQHDVLARRIWRMYTRLVEQRDLPLLARAGKGIAVTFQGDDARQADVLRGLGRGWVDEAPAGHYLPASDAHKRLRIARFDRWAGNIYALNPDLLRVLPERARFMPYGHVDPRNWTPVPSPEGEPIRIGHAPTNRGVKGTAHVIEAVGLLQAEGLPVELLLVEGVPNDEARRVYERAHVLVDQVLVGWYGGLAVELMALGKPVVCCLREDDVRLLPAEMQAQIPIVRADPKSLADVLRRLVTAPRGELEELGRRGRAYVERWHDPLRIAAGLKGDYEAMVAAVRR